MSLFIKITAGVLLTAILSLVLSKQGKDFSLLLTLMVGCMVVIASVGFLQPVVSFLTRLAEAGQLRDDFLNLLLKIVGIGLLSQIAGMVCTDAGNQSLNKVLQLMTTAVILWVSIPLFEQLLSLFESVLGAV